MLIFYIVFFKGADMKKILLITAVLIIASFQVSGASPSSDVVLLLSDSDKDIQSVSQAFQAEFGKDVSVINLEGSDIKQKEEGEKLEAEPPELAVVVGDLAAQAAKWYLGDVPVVYCNSFRAAKLSLTEMKAAGVYYEPDPADQLDSIREVFPDVKKVGLLYAPEFSLVKEGQIKSKARARNIDIQISTCDDVKELPARLKTLMPQVDIVWVLTDPQVLSKHSNRFIVMQSISMQVPVFCGEESLGLGGATAALVPSPESVGKTAAREAKKVLKGRTPEPGTLVYPEGRLIINQKMAGNFNIDLDSDIMEKAVQVIK